MSREEQGIPCKSTNAWAAAPISLAAAAACRKSGPASLHPSDDLMSLGLVRGIRSVKLWLVEGVTGTHKWPRGGEASYSFPGVGYHPVIHTLSSSPNGSKAGI